MNKIGEIAINVSGTIIQTIEVTDDAYSFDDVVRLIRDGDAFTSVGHGQDNGCVVLLDSSLPLGYKNIAKVVAQEAGDDVEITLEDEDVSGNECEDYVLDF